MDLSITYFLPAGAGGIGTLALAANSSKVSGFFRCPNTQRSRQRFNSPMSGSPLGVTTGAMATDFGANTGSCVTAEVAATSAGVGPAAVGFFLPQPVQNKTPVRASARRIPVKACRPRFNFASRTDWQAALMTIGFGAGRAGIIIGVKTYTIPPKCHVLKTSDRRSQVKHLSCHTSSI